MQGAKDASNAPTVPTSIAKAIVNFDISWTTGQHHRVEKF